MIVIIVLKLFGGVNSLLSVVLGGVFWILLVFGLLVVLSMLCMNVSEVLLLVRMVIFFFFSLVSDLIFLLLGLSRSIRLCLRIVSVCVCSGILEFVCSMVRLVCFWLNCVMVLVLFGLLMILIWN